MPATGIIDPKPPKCTRIRADLYVFEKLLTSDYLGEASVTRGVVDSNDD
jgi:hypothetical protein